MDTSTLFSVATSITDYQSHNLWVLIAGFVLAFLLGFGMGANDVANAFGTSVGSKVLNLRTAYVLASIFELLGALLVGYNVTDTMRKSVVDLDLYADAPHELLLGEVAILAGGSVWLILATLLRAPVSTTHSIVGATLGFTLLRRGTAGIHWDTVGRIALSWVLSPLLSGVVSATLYMIVDFAVLRRRNPLKCGLRMLPVFYFFCIAFNTFAVSYQGSKLLRLSDVPLWLALALAVGTGLLAAMGVQLIARGRLVAWINRVAPSRIDTRLTVISSGRINVSAEKGVDGVAKKKWEGRNERKQEFWPTPVGFANWFLPAKARHEDAKTLKLFASIQVFTACFAGFAHGANDVSNAIAPLTALVSVYGTMSVQQEEPTPLYMLFYGVLSICVGLWLLGHRVIKTVGQRMSEINPASGFTIEFGAAVTVLVASKLGLPVSTTHCLVGSVVAVGSLKSGEGIDWKIFGGVALSWVVTLPASAAISAAIMFLLNMLMPN